MTSLSVAIDLASTAIAEPPPERVYDTCKYAYETARAERRSYSRCVEAQGAQCSAEFETALGRAVAASESALLENRAALDLFRAAQASCE